MKTQFHLFFHHHFLGWMSVIRKDIKDIFDNVYNIGEDQIILQHQFEEICRKLGHYLLCLLTFYCNWY